jgi:hypothetical protein
MTRLRAGLRVGIPVVATDFTLFQNLKTRSGDHPASYSIGPGVFNRGKAAGA